MELTELLPDEQYHEVNDKIKIIQKKDSLLFGSDALFLAAYMKKCKGLAYEFGGGSGIISLLAAQRGKFQKIRVFEVQPELASVIGRNIEINNLTETVTAYAMDIRDIRKSFPEEYADVIFSNPPYMTDSCGKRNESERKYISRHEVFGTIFDFCRAASDSLKYGGLFYCVYREDRLCDLICALRENGLEPKRMTMIMGNENSRPSMVLTESKKGANCSLFVTKPLYIKQNGADSEDAKYIYDNGEFSEQFRKA